MTNELERECSTFWQRALHYYILTDSGNSSTVVIYPSPRERLAQNSQSKVNDEQSARALLHKKTFLSCVIHTQRGNPAVRKESMNHCCKEKETN